MRRPEEFCQTSIFVNKELSRGISLKEVRVDRFLEGAVGIQEYKNYVNPRPQFKDISPDCVNV